MKSLRRIRLRSGHTLIELITAMVSGTILLAGLGVVTMIASQVANTPSASTQRVDAAEAVNEFGDDARYATLITTRSTRAIEFVVADRDGDGAAERIRYEWSGVPGASLMKTYNGGTPVAVVDSVQDFQLSYKTAAQTTVISTTTDSAVAKLLSNENSMSSTRGVTAEQYSAQALDPSGLAAAGRLTWNITQVDFQASRSGFASQTLLVQLRSTGAPNNSPTGEVLGEVQLAENSLANSIGWKSVPLASPLRGLQFHRNYALVLARTTADGTSSTTASAAALRTNTNDYSPLRSTDGGATWEYTSSAQMNYRIWGTYTSLGSTQNLVRNFAKRIDVVLQAGSAASSRVNASIPLANSPELLAAYWRADFDANPTTLDVTRDGVADWAMASGTFDMTKLVNGVWQATGALESRPKSNFTTNTIIDVRCRNTASGGNGAVLQFSADRQGGTHGPLVVRVQRQSDGTQTLTLYGKSNDATLVQLFQRKNLPSSLIRYGLTILPAPNLVNLTIENEDQGTFSYPTFAPSADDRFLTLYTDNSSSEFDYVELRVPE